MLLVHGILDSADAWVSFGDSSPALVLASQGYDVWLLNLRGSKKSKNHVTLPTNSEEFWNFSWEENGLYDIPNTMDFILSKVHSKYTKVAMITHSMGSTAALFGMSMKPEFYSEKLSLFVALATPLTLKNISSPLYKLIGKDPNSYFVYGAIKVFKVNEIFPSNWINNGIFRLVCSRVPSVCKLGDFLLADYDPNLNNPDAALNYFSHYPAGGSLKQVWHYVQCSNSGHFQRYDYGKLTNLVMYNQAYPPEIDLKKIKNVKIAMIAG